MHPDDGRVVSNFMMQALAGDDLTVYGDGSQTRSFCYVDDLIEALIRLMNGPDELHQPINFGNGQEISVLEIARQIIAATGSRARIVFKPLPADDPKQRCPDTSAAKALLDWSPSTPLAQGLAQTVRYFMQREARRAQIARAAASDEPFSSISPAPRHTEGLAL